MILCTPRLVAAGLSRIGTGSISCSAPSISCAVTGPSITPAKKPNLPGAISIEVYADYYERIRAMARSGLIDCMAHLDLVKIFGFRPTKDFGEVLDAVLCEIRDANLAMELSTAGWRKPVGELYPSDEIIRAAMAKEIPFTTASDGHSHVQQGENFDRLADKMSELDLREVNIFERHERRLIML